MRNTKYTLSIILIMIISFNWIIAQDIDTGSYQQNIPQTSTRYITDEDGQVRMWINIWGHVNKPGNYLVYNNTDVITILAMAGGLRSGAALNRIKLFRELPDAYGNKLYTINMKEFVESAERNVFPIVLPNDAFYVPEKTSSYILSKVGLLNTTMSAINLYYLAMLRRDQNK